MGRLAASYWNRRVALQLPLGYASGLPYLLSGETLGAWMKTEGITLQAIGAFSMVGLAYTLKIAWAPLLDRFPLPLLGRRRGWLLAFQLALIAALIALGTAEPARAPLRTVALALLVAVLSASQDIVADAYRTDVLREEERSQGASLFTIGYRLGFLVAGAGALLLAQPLGWARDYRLISLSMGIGVVATLLAPEPERAVARPRSVVDAYLRPFDDLVRRPGALLIIAFVVLYRFGYALARPMNTPFLIELGFPTAAIGTYRKGVGLLATLLGGLIAGPAVARLGLKRALWIFGVALALVHLSWVALVYTGPQPFMLAISIAVENVFIGLSITAFDTYLMVLCNSSYSATQFAALAALSSAAGWLLGGGSGVLAHGLGWAAFFALTSVLAIPSLLMVRRLPEVELATAESGARAAR